MNGNDLAGKWTTRDWRTELELELKTNILGFWMDKVPSAHDDGFVGEIGSDLAVREDADRSLVLNARILWTFAAAYRRYADPAYMDMADRAYRYLHEHFLDREHEGYYWAVRADGTPAETKKQVYGQAFVIYALSEYAQALDAAGSAADPQRREEASAQAQRLFGLIEAHSRDGRFGGYIEAHARDWSDTEDLSLSGKDLNEKKSMNTHLHVLEGYTNLYRIRPSDELRLRLSELVEVTLTHIVDSSTGHFHLFFDEQWNVKSDHISYGHDIEGSWLLVEAAEVLGDEALLERVRHTALQMAQAVLERGLDTDGGLWNEAAGGRLIDDNKDWWPQAEAMVGFHNAYELTGSSAYLEAAQRSWAFIRDYIVDREHGEWYWSVSNDRVPNTKDAKVSAWKCPYHNSRACFEMLARLERLEAAGASSDTLFEQRKRKVTRSHEALLAKPNRKAEPGNGVYDRYIDPVLTAAHAPLIWKYDFNPATNPYFSERLGVGGAFNPGAIYLNGKYVLVARVEGADRKSFFAAAESDRPTEGFRFRDRPIRMPETAEPDINVYDMRLVQHEDGWIYGLFCTERRDPSAAPSDLSSAVAQCGIARTRDLEVWERLADLKTPSAQQRNVVLHPEFVDGKYAFYTRPQDGFIDAGSGGGIGWGLSDTIENAVIDREIIMDERAYHTIKEVKNGQGPAPIKTDKGWLHIAHGVRGTAAGLRYVLYAFLSDLAEPWKVTHRPGGHLLAPEGIERVGDVSNVLFCNGVTVNEAGEVHIYYASSDTRIHVAETSVDRLLDYVTNTPEDPLRSYTCVEQRLELIERNLAYLEQQNR